MGFLLSVPLHMHRHTDTDRCRCMHTHAGTDRQTDACTQRPTQTQTDRHTESNDLQWHHVLTPFCVCFQWFSALLMLPPFNTVPHILLLLYNCNFAAVMNHDINIWYTGYLICITKWVTTHRLRTTVVDSSQPLYLLPHNSFVCLSNIIDISMAFTTLQMY